VWSRTLSGQVRLTSIEFHYNEQFPLAGINPYFKRSQGFFIDFKLRDDIHCPVVIPDGAEYLPPAVRAALRTIARHIDTLPLTAHDNRSFYRGLETLTDRLITIAKQHNLIYPPGD
jgi:hypothetical protein